MPDLANVLNAGLRRMNWAVTNDRRYRKISTKSPLTRGTEQALPRCSRTIVPSQFGASTILLTRCVLALPRRSQHHSRAVTAKTVTSAIQPDCRRLVRSAPDGLQQRPAAHRGGRRIADRTPYGAGKLLSRLPERSI